MIVEIGDKIVDRAGSTYLVNHIIHDGFTYHTHYGGTKVNVTCIDGPNVDKTMDVSYNLILKMRESGDIVIMENENE